MKLSAALAARAVPRAGRVGSPLLDVVMFVGCIALTSCAKRETTVDAGIRTQTLHIGNWAEPESLDPHVLGSDSASKITNALFEGLVTIANDAQTILPGAADRWEISSDGKTYTFHLRANARWSNGDAVTSTDFVASFQRLMEPALIGPYPSLAYPIAGARDFIEKRSRDFASVGVRAIDQRTVVITLQHRAPYFLWRLGNVPFFPVHLPTVDKFGPRDRRETPWTKPGTMVGNGAFVLAEWRVNERVVAVANPHYWDAARVRLKSVVFYPIDDTDVEERNYRARQLHVTDMLPVSKRSAYRDRGAPEFHQTRRAFTDFIEFNTTKPPFHDARIRRAFALAIDRERLVAGGLGGFATAAHSLTPPGVGGYAPAGSGKADPAQARALLADAGYPGGSGFTSVEWILPGKDSTRINAAEVIQEMWRKELGVAVRLSTPEFKVYRDYRHTKNYQIATMGWGYSVNDPVDLLELATSRFAYNDSGWSNPVYDRAFADSEEATSDAQRIVAFDVMENLLAVEASFVPLYHSQKVRLVHPSVRGWRDNAFEIIDWRELWLEAPK